MNEFRDSRNVAPGPGPRRLALSLLLAAFGALAGAESPTVPGGSTLSILYFDNVAKAEDFEWLRAGLSDMLTTDIAASGAVTVVERERLAKVLGEQELQLSGMVQEGDAVRVGTILAASKIVYGSFVVTGQSLRIEARLVDTQSAAVLGAVRAEGASGEVLDLERKIATGIIAALGLSAGSAPSSGGTSVMGAAAAYYRGLASLDSGAYQDAATRFREAAALDPAYEKPQTGLEAAYRFLKDFKRQRQQRELVAIAASLQRLRSRLKDKFYSFADMVARPRDFGFADIQAATTAYAADPRGYAGDSPVQAMWDMQVLLLEMETRAEEYFSDHAFADRCDAEIGRLAAAAETQFPKDPFLAETQYMALMPLKRGGHWAELKTACERIMTDHPDFRMAWAVEDMYQAALDKLSGKN